MYSKDLNKFGFKVIGIITLSCSYGSPMEFLSGASEEHFPKMLYEVLYKALYFIKWWSIGH